MNRDSILLDIVAERIRQDRLCREGRFPHTLAEPHHTGGLSPEACLAVVAEEFGEVAEVIADKLAGKPLDLEHLRDELIQLAACAVAWVEQIDEVPQLAPPLGTDRLPPPPRTPGGIAANHRAPSYVPRAGAASGPPPVPRAYGPEWLDLLPDYGGAL